ncbi:MAG: hypothetical protein QNJ65_08070 [Xenococcaceae cyanobacterium MO_234.B1]|nr:hypothetical protein [Xenococcaceae cyanobacterium MO_234.B1]
MINNNLNNSVATLLDKYPVEDILFTLYCKVDDRLRNTNQGKDKLQQQVHALDVACEMLDDLDDELWINRIQVI